MTAENEVLEARSDSCREFPSDLETLFDIVRTGHFSSANPGHIARDLHDEIHRMAGAAQCMGFRELGRALSRIEEKLAKGLTNRRRPIEEVLKESVPRLTEIAQMTPIITPENSRVAQLLKQQRISDAISGLLQETPWLEAELRDIQILFADDDPHVRQVMQANLAECGIKNLRTVSSGLEALKDVKTFTPDIIISDWHMKPVTGLELLQTVRKGGTSLPVDIPIIFFTSEKDQTNRMQAMCEGVTRFLKKPVSPEVLVTTLRDILVAKYPQRYAS